MCLFKKSEEEEKGVKERRRIWWSFVSFRSVEASRTGCFKKERSRLLRLAQFLSTCRLLFEKRTRHFESAASSPWSLLSPFFPFFSSTFSPSFFNLGCKKFPRPTSASSRSACSHSFDTTTIVPILWLLHHWSVLKGSAIRIKLRFDFDFWTIKVNEQTN